MYKHPLPLPPDDVDYSYAVLFIVLVFGGQMAGGSPFPSPPDPLGRRRGRWQGKIEVSVASTDTPRSEERRVS